MDSPDTAGLPPADRLRQSRAEIASLLPHDSGPDEFPRSRLMKAIVSGNGRLLVVGAALAVAVVRPRLGRYLLKLAPLGTSVTQALSALTRN